MSIDQRCAEHRNIFFKDIDEEMIRIEGDLFEGKVETAERRLNSLNATVNEYGITTLTRNNVEKTDYAAAKRFFEYRMTFVDRMTEKRAMLKGKYSAKLDRMQRIFDGSLNKSVETKHAG